MKGMGDNQTLDTIFSRASFHPSACSGRIAHGMPAACGNCGRGSVSGKREKAF